MSSVLVIEDDPFASKTLADYLTRAGHSVLEVRSAEDGVAVLSREMIDVVICDLMLPGMTGLDFLRETRGDDAPPVIVVTGETEINVAVMAMRAGAADYVAKPLTMKVLEHVLCRVVETAKLRRTVTRLEREVSSDPDPVAVCASPAMSRVLEMARRCAASNAASALLVGESGVGKEVVAAYIHRASPRAKGPFVRINVVAMPETMVEAELFGAVRGAFTDSRRDRQGFFSAADGGTLLLDEIGELRIELQAKLLRAIETKRFYPVGASRDIASDVRIIAATNRDPAEAVASGRLRSDLYYRLATIVIRIPSLRERREDIAPLARTMLGTLRRSMGRGPSQLADNAMAALIEYDWPGNVRELRNAIERVTMLVDDEVASLRDLENCGVFSGMGGAGPSTPAPASVSPLRAAEPAILAAAIDELPQSGSLEEVARTAYEAAERKYILATLERTKGNRTKAAELLNVSRSTLWQKFRRYGLDDGSM